MGKSVIIVAGGSGKRMGEEIPKQFILLKERPVLMWTISNFVRFDAGMNILVVLPASQIESWEELCYEHNFKEAHLIVKGGETRFHSVRNGLDALPESDLVAIHDGVRPLVSQKTIANCFAEAALTGAAIPVLPVNETLRMGTMNYSKTIDRSTCFSVQTPQVFKMKLLKEAYLQPWDATFTDDASVFEKKGYRVTMVPGNQENIKITHPADLIFAGELLNTKEDIL